jgi:hypothetical protein
MAAVSGQRRLWQASTTPNLDGTVVAPGSECKIANLPMQLLQNRGGTRRRARLHP